MKFWIFFRFISHKHESAARCSVCRMPALCNFNERLQVFSLPLVPILPYSWLDSLFVSSKIFIMSIHGRFRPFHSIFPFFFIRDPTSRILQASRAWVPIFVFRLESVLFSYQYLFQLHSFQSHSLTVPYGKKFPKSAHDCRIFYVISADFDTDRLKKTILRQF